MKHIVFLLLVTSLGLLSCKQKNTDVVSPTLSEEQLEAREDSVELALAYEAQESIKLTLYPKTETAVAYADPEDDAADDPAIWINPSNKNESLIYGSNKTLGIATYNLDGDEVAFDKVGKINNIEVLYDFMLNGKKESILGGSNRTTQSIDLYLIAQDGKLSPIGSKAMKSDIIDDVYGFCFAKDIATGKSYAIVNGKNGMMEQYEMVAQKDSIVLQLARSVQFDSQTEGMVADNRYGKLYVGEENAGIWKLSIDPTSTAKTMLSMSSAENTNIRYDIEGLTLLELEDKGYLVASSQGNFTFALFDRLGNNDYITSFKILGNTNVDGVEETDGLEINTTPLGEAYPQGIMVVQDGFNYDGDTLKPQNYKYVSVADLLEQL